MCEPAREIHRRLEHVICIGNEGSKVAAFEQDLGNRVLFRWNLMPTRGVMPMPTSVEIISPRETPHPCKVATTYLKRRLPFTKRGV